MNSIKLLLILACSALTCRSADLIPITMPLTKNQEDEAVQRAKKILSSKNALSINDLALEKVECRDNLDGQTNLVVSFIIRDTVVTYSDKNSQNTTTKYKTVGVQFITKGGIISDHIFYGKVSTSEFAPTIRLINAAVNNDMRAAKRALAEGASITAADKEGWTALMHAINHRHEDMAKLLIDAGADVNAKSNKGRTLLMEACYKQLSQVVKMLLDKNANPNAQDNEGISALIAAAMAEDKDSITNLLRVGANVTISPKNGETALIWAIAHNNIDIVRLLIDQRADVNTKDLDGLTPLGLAKKLGGRQAIEELITQHGGHK